MWTCLLSIWVVCCLLFARNCEITKNIHIYYNIQIVLKNSLLDFSSMKPATIYANTSETLCRLLHYNQFDCLRFGDWHFFLSLHLPSFQFHSCVHTIITLWLFRMNKCSDAVRMTNVWILFDQTFIGVQPDFFTFPFWFKHSYRNLVFVGHFDCLLCGFSSRISSVCFMVIPISLMGMQVSHIPFIFPFQTYPICISCHSCYFMAFSASYFLITCGKWKSIHWEVCGGTPKWLFKQFFSSYTFFIHGMRILIWSIMKSRISFN